MRIAQPILILGATSSIARATASEFAARGHPLYLAGRNIEELQRMASDLMIRHQGMVKCGKFIAEDYSLHDAFLKRVIETMGELEGVLLAFGYMTTQCTINKKFDEANATIVGNFSGAVSILNHCANYFECRGGGFIVGISSVAGDRGRQSNYVYGASKGALSLYLQGLRNRLWPKGVRVITIKLGFVDTPMTFGKPGLFLVASPHHIGQGIVKAIQKTKDIVYLPWFWRYIMFVITLIPEKIFKRLKL